MSTYRVYLQTMASTVIDVEVADDLDGEQARDAALEAAYQETPGLCHQCTGYGGRAGIELSGEWELPKPDADWDPVEKIA